MKALALETSSTAGSVAICDGERVIERPMDAPRQQARLILGLVDALLDEARLELPALDAVVVSRGPGSFTGLRMAAGVAQGLAMAAGLPVVAVSSLAGLAQAAWREAGAERALVLVDARMGEVYAGEFAIREGLAVATGGAERLMRPGAVEPPGGAWVGVGDGFSAYAALLEGPIREARAVLDDLKPRARDLLPLAAADFERGHALKPETVTPVYLRGRDAWSSR